MSKMTFDDIENVSVRQLAKVVSRTKAWTESDPLYRKLRPQIDPNGHFLPWQLWQQFTSQKERQTRLKAELTRYMKRLPHMKGESQGHMQTIIASIVTDLATIQDEFIYWQKEVEKWLTTLNT